jgi:hypothetical protein
VHFIKHNPTSYTVEIDNKENSSFLLVLKEHFDSRWRLEGASAHHVMANGFANGWIIDEPGAYKVTLYYWPQRYFYIGLVITGISLVSLAIFWGVTRIKK